MIERADQSPRLLLFGRALERIRGWLRWCILVAWLLFSIMINIVILILAVATRAPAGALPADPLALDGRLAIAADHVVAIIPQCLQSSKHEDDIDAFSRWL